MPFYHFLTSHDVPTLLLCLIIIKLKYLLVVYPKDQKFLYPLEAKFCLLILLEISSH